MPLLVILDFLSALLPKKIALQNFLYNLCVWESSNRTQHLRMSSNHKGSVSTQRYLMLVKLQGVFGSPSFRKIRSTFKFKWRRDVTEVFFKLFKGAAVPLMQLEPIQLSTNSFETFQARALSLLAISAAAFTFLLSQNTLTSCVPYICKCQCWRRCHVNGTRKIQVGICRPWSRWTQ